MKHTGHVVELNPADCRFDISSVVDPVGRVFRYQDRLYRGITPQYVDDVLQVLHLAEKHDMYALGLIPSSKTDFSLSDYPLIIEHREVPFISLRSEWCGEGLRAAALCVLRVAAALGRVNYCLKDAHTWNVLFDRTMPYVVDWGSIRPIHEFDWNFWYFQFRKYFMMPLYFFSLGKPDIARAMLREHHVGVANVLLDITSFKYIPDVPYGIYTKYAERISPAAFEELSAYIASLEFPKVQGEWVDYEQPRLSGAAGLSSLRDKDTILNTLMASAAGRTVIDIGCNYGLHSEMCADLGKRVVAVDIEETCLNDLYMRTVQSRKDILPLYTDFMWPVGESGLMNTFAAVHDRLQCDIVIVMALIHHIAFKYYASFDAIARNIGRFTRRRAIVEFVPADDWHVARWSPERLPWYTMEKFIAAMLTYFQTYTVVPSAPHPRKILIFENKKP
jgi:SAM-dependent methyltransferase